MRKFSQKRGASGVIVMTMLVPVLIIGFFAISLANIQRSESTSQISTDLAAVYGGNLLSRESDVDKILSLSEELALRNLIPNANQDSGESPPEHLRITTELGSASIGQFKPSFDSQAKPTNAIRVTAAVPAGIIVFGSRLSHVDVSAHSTVANMDRVICLVVDRSGSMTFDLDSGTWLLDPTPHPDNPMSTHPDVQIQQNAGQWWKGWPHPTRSRWSELLPAVYGLADELEKTNQQEFFSIVSYSSAGSEHRWNHKLKRVPYRTTDSSIEVRPTKHYANAVRKLEHKYSKIFPVMGGTNIAAGIDTGARVLLNNNSKPNAFKTMIVMTDGQYNRGRAPWLAAEDAAKQGIEVFTVTFSNQADQQSMILTAEVGNGKHFHAVDGVTLEEIFRKIANMPPRIFVD